MKASGWLMVAGLVVVGVALGLWLGAVAVVLYVGLVLIAMALAVEAAPQREQARRARAQMDERRRQHDQAAERLRKAINREGGVMDCAEDREK